MTEDEKRDIEQHARMYAKMANERTDVLMASMAVIGQMMQDGFAKKPEQEAAGDK